MRTYQKTNRYTTGGTPANRVLTACQKMKTLAGHCDLTKYYQQIIMALAYWEKNR